MSPIQGPDEILVDHSGQYVVTNALGAQNAYTWSIESNWSIYTSGPVGGGQAAIVIASSASTKKLTVLTSNICGTRSTWKYIDGITDCNISVNIYPNPSLGDELVINIIPPPGDCNTNLFSSSQNATLSMRNSDGEIVTVRELTETETKLTDLQLAPGLYFLELKLNDKKYEKRVIIK